MLVNQGKSIICPIRVMFNNTMEVNMHKNIIVIVTLCMFFSNMSFAQTEVSGLINTNTTWDSTGNPYIVVGNIDVMNTTLTIEHGVEVII